VRAKKGEPIRARRTTIIATSMTETPVQVIGQPAAAGDDTA
jgi:hypothetical protein